MRRPPRPLALLVMVCFLAAACTRTPPGGESRVGLGSAGGGLSGADGTFDGASSLDGAGFDDFGGNGGATGNGTPGGPGGRVATGGSPGSPRTPATTAGGGATEAATGSTAQGINGRTIKIVFHHQRENCGDNPQGQNVANPKGERAIAGYVQFFNEEVLAPLNWKLEYDLVDNGGLQCPEKAQAAALQIAKEIKPFAVLGSSVNPDRGPVLADAVTRAGFLHIGPSFQSRAGLAARRGLIWPTFGTAEEAMDDLATFIEARVKGTPVPDRSVPTAPLVERVYGMIAVDTPDGKAMAQFTQQRMAQMGIDLGDRIYLISGDMGVAAQTASNTVLKMRQDGVNTLLWGFYAGAGSTYTFSEAMNSQNYLPDILTGTFGIGFWDQLHNRRVWENAYGTAAVSALALRTAITASGPVEEFDNIAENVSAFIDVWQEYLGNNDNPQDSSSPGAYDTWSQLALLVTGIMHAGPELNYDTFARSLSSARYGQPNRCTVARWVGRDYRYEGSFDWNTDGRGGRYGYTTIYWVNEQTTFGTNGLYESFDNYRMFRPGEALPPQPTHDTGQRGTSIPKQKQIGVRAWTPCSQFPNFPTTLD